MEGLGVDGFVDSIEDTSTRVGREEDEFVPCMPCGLAAGAASASSIQGLLRRGVSSVLNECGEVLVCMMICCDTRYGELEWILGVRGSGEGSAKLTRENLRDSSSSSSSLIESPLPEAVARLVEDLCGTLSVYGIISLVGSCSVSPILSSRSSSDNSSSSIGSIRDLPLVIRYTPKKVSRQPPTNFTTLSAVAFAKSRYKTALPMITDNVNMTN